MNPTEASSTVGSSIQAAIVDAPGREPRIGTTDRPVGLPGTTLLQVLAAPLNPLDILIASGTFHSARHDDAYVPGSECVGVVLESDAHPRGTRVYAECHASPSTPGAFSSHVVVDDADILPLPDGLDPISAAAIGNSGTAAFLPLVDRAGLKPGESVLILGATGAVGQLAVQIAAQRGAGRVTGVARDRETLERLLTIGADEVVALRPDEDALELAARIRAAASGEVDVVVDCLYGLPLEAAVQVCAPGARIVNVGNSAGDAATFPAGLLRGRQLTITGFAGLHTPLNEKKAALEWLWNALGRGDLQLNVTAIPLDELPEAWRAQQTSAHAKFVVIPR